MSAYIMLHLGKVEARRLIGGTAYAYKTEAEAAIAPSAVKQFGDAHGTPAQRFYNLLCIAYGADAQPLATWWKRHICRGNEPRPAKTNTGRLPMPTKG